MRWRVLLDTRCTGAVALLALNDHVLKGRFPGWWTGKLSDVAGVFLVAVVLGLVLGRPRLAGALTVVAFAALKVVPVVAVLVAPVLGGVTRRDPTDLLALFAVWPAVRFLDGRVPPMVEPALLGQVLAVAAAGVMVLAVSATSCDVSPSIDGFAIGGDGVVVARLTVAGYEYEGGSEPTRHTWAASADGGGSWSSTRRPSSPVGTATQACDDRVGCFRTDGRRVEHQASSTSPWRTSFAFTAGERRALLDRSNRVCGHGVAGAFGAVTMVRRPDGAHVVVSMGGQGVLHRSPSGRWERRGVLDLDPVSTGRSVPFRWLLLAPVLLVAATVVVPLWIGVRRRRLGRGIAGLVVGLAGASVVGTFAAAASFGDPDAPVPGLVVVGLSVAVFLGSVALARSGHPADGPKGPVRPKWR